MSGLRHDLASQVAGIARDVSFNQGSLALINEGAEFASQGLRAPALNTYLALEDVPLTVSTLEITRSSDGHLYTPGADYVQREGGFLNVRIPAGTQIFAEYLKEDTVAYAHRIRYEGLAFPQRSNLELAGVLLRVEDVPEQDTTRITAIPANQAAETWIGPVLLNSWVGAGSPYAPVGYYRDRERVYLRGRIEAGTAATGTVLFSVPAGYRPPYEEAPLVMTDAGPVTLAVEPNGEVSIGDGPLAAGNDWLSLDGVSWRAQTGYGPRYPNTNRYPESVRYPNSGSASPMTAHYPSASRYPSTNRYPSD